MILPARLLLLIAAVVVAGAHSRAYAQKPTRKVADHNSWAIKWSASDEFNGEQPDWKKWSKTDGLPDTHSWQWNNADNVTLDNGHARIWVRHNQNNNAASGTYFQSGILKSYRTFPTDCFFEARIRAASFPGSGVCASFWLYSDFADDVAEGHTVYSEIDVVELQQFDFFDGKQDDARDMDLNLHCVTKQNGARYWMRPKAFPETQLNKWRAPWDPRDDFHVYGCQVNKEEIIWFIDGEEIARQPNTHWHRPKHLALSLGLRRPFVEFKDNRNNAIDPMKSDSAREKLPDLPASMVVDYVRIWESEKK